MKLLWILLAALLASQAAAEEILMARVQMYAPDAMAELQTGLRRRGYVVAHEQKCDGGMIQFGFETDYYRVAFFGKLDEVRALSDDFPELTPYLPLKVAVVAEGDESLLIALDPRGLAQYFPGSGLEGQFERWRDDMLSVVEDVRQAADRD